MSYSKTFCPYPWIHLMTQPMGTTSWCCISREQFLKEDGTMFDLNQGDDIGDIWNSEHMKQIREKMLNGEKVSGCEHCYDMEELGFKSYRENFINDWMGPNSKHFDEILERIEYSIENNFSVNKPPIYLDFRLSNLCNLKCRMCQPQNSSTINKEYNEILQNNEEDGQFLKDNFTWGGFADGITPWQDNPKFLKQVEEWLPGVNKLYFTGGEPTIIDRTYWILDKCIEMGIAHKIDLLFNSNMTNIQRKFIDKLSKFNNVMMCVSVDGFEKVNNYIRGNSHWNIIDKHIQEYCSAGVIGDVILTPVVQVYNILNITDLLDYAEQTQLKTTTNVGVDFLINTYPPTLDIRILPDNVREEAIKRIEDWKKRSKVLMKRPHNAHAVNTIITTLKEKRRDDWEHQLKIFKQYTELLDKKRNQSMKEFLPELYEMMYE